MTLEDINDEVSTFMFEGHDTTSSAIEWALYCVARDRRIYKKIKDEINEELGI
jgi:cytochrome P450